MNSRSALPAAAALVLALATTTVFASPALPPPSGRA